jgi:hypothetical protein
MFMTLLGVKRSGNQSENLEAKATLNYDVSSIVFSDSHLLEKRPLG